jgi:hypothetical protein
MRKISIYLTIIAIILIYHADPALAERGGFLAGVQAGIERGGAMVGGKVSYFIPIGDSHWYWGPQLDVAHGFDVAKNESLSVTTVLGGFVLAVPLDNRETTFLHLKGGAGPAFFEIPRPNQSITDAAMAYGGGLGLAVFFMPAVALTFEIQVIGFDGLSKIILDKDTLGLIGLGIAYRF